MIPKQTFYDDRHIYAVIETPKGSRNKCTYNREGDFFELGKVLPAGLAFPLDFGFIPNTKGGDGDPLDVMVFGDAAAFMGLVVKCRVIGVIEVLQKEKGQRQQRNDRILAVAVESADHAGLQDIKDINAHFMDELLNFFKYYNQMAGKKFRAVALRNASAALKTIKKSSQ